MAIELKLFERVESGKGLFAVESISLIYNALTTILILLLYPRMDHPGMMLLERLGIVVLTFVLIYLYQAFPCRLTAFVRMVVQMSLLAYWYPDTFEFNRLFPNLDYVFASAEQAIFIASLRWNLASCVLPCGSVSLSIWGISFTIP